jgi:hypothetical protein
MPHLVVVLLSEPLVCDGRSLVSGTALRLRRSLVRISRILAQRGSHSVFLARNSTPSLDVRLVRRSVRRRREHTRALLRCVHSVAALAVFQVPGQVLRDSLGSRCVCPIRGSWSRLH